MPLACVATVPGPQLFRGVGKDGINVEFNYPVLISEYVKVLVLPYYW